MTTSSSRALVAATYVSDRPRISARVLIPRLRAAVTVLVLRALRAATAQWGLRCLRGVATPRAIRLGRFGNTTFLIDLSFAVPAPSRKPGRCCHVLLPILEFAV
jgi:hypothetical protein